MTVETVDQANKTGHDDPLLIKETGEIRVVAIVQGVAITGTVEALTSRKLISYRIDDRHGKQFRTFYIKLINN